MAAFRKQVDVEGLSALAQRLVRTPSLSTQEGAVAGILAEAMLAAGWDAVTIDRMGNVLGRIGPAGDPGLVLDGHMHTVGPGDHSSWARDHYSGEISDGVLYGRGACDMKGALAAMVYAGACLREHKDALKAPVILAAVVQEEPCEGMAIRHIVEVEGLKPSAVVIGEATDLQLARGQRGRIELQVDVHGRSCHASAPERGINAIYEATRLVFALQLQAPQLNNDSFLGKGSLAVTAIASEAGSRNVIPDYCMVYIDRRLTIGETEATALAEVRRVLLREAIKAEVHVPRYRATSYTGLICEQPEVYPPWITPEDSALIRQASAAIAAEVGIAPRLTRWSFSTDGVYTAGVAGIPTVGFGPGEERYAHTVEDQVRIDDLAAAAAVYAAMALRLCS
ncbi:MAG: YgeY family selenium metabolism-linked hydrolase [Anaerolineales bacterium]